MGYQPPTIDPSDQNYALRTFRKALSARTYKAVDVFLLGDSLTEGYYASASNKRWANVLRQGLQAVYNPPGVPGGEGFVPAVYSLGGSVAAPAAPIGSINLPQRWDWRTGTLPSSGGDFGFGFGRRAVFLDAITKYGTLVFYGDRIWLHYTLGVGVGWFGVGIDAKVSNIITVGALSGTGTGTFVVADGTHWPSGSFTVTVDDEDMTVSNGSGTALGTLTITARGINSTVAVAHSTVGTPAMYAPAGVTRVSTRDAAPVRFCGRYWDSGALFRGQHTLSVMPINKTSFGYAVVIDGATMFDGDGASGPGSFNDGTPISSTVAAASNGVNVNAIPGGILNVASTTGFPTSGIVSVATASGVQQVTYTGVTALTLTGCTSTGAGVMSTGGVVVSQHYDSVLAKFVSLDTKNQFRAPNLPGGNVVISTVVSGTRVKLSTPPTATGTGQTFSLGGRGAGIRVWEGGHAGYTSAAFGGPAGTAAGYWADGLDVADPDLVIIWFGANECGQGYTQAQFHQYLTDCINLINAKSTVTPSILLMVGWLSSLWTQPQYQPYIDTIYNVANAKGAAVFDMNARFPQQQPGDMSADGLHLTDLGSAQLALELEKFLVGSDETDLPAPVTYDWSLAMKTWRAGLGMVAIRPVDIVFLGDSISEGYYSSSDRTRYVDMIRQRLQAYYNPSHIPGGEGYIPMIHTVGGHFNAAAPTGFTNLPQRWTFTLPPEALGAMTGGSSGGYGLGRRAWYYVNGSTSKASITVECDRFWILYTKFTLGGILTVKIDTILQANQPSTVSGIVQSGFIWDSGPLTPGMHTIEVSASLAGLVIPDGIMVFNGDCGDYTVTDGQTFTNTRLVSTRAYFQQRDVGKVVTTVGNTPIPAATTITKFISPSEVTLSANTLTTASNVTFTMQGRGAGIRTWDSALSGAYAATFAGPAGTAQGLWADALENIDPDLVLVQFGPNDSNPTSPIQPSVYQQNLVDIVKLIRAKTHNDPSIVFVSNWVSGLTTLQNWQGYRDAMFQVATTEGCGIFDLSMRMGPGPAVGNTDLFSDPLHLTDEGAYVSANEHLWGLGVQDPVQKMGAGISRTAVTTIANTETSIVSKVIPANTLRVGSTFRLKVMGLQTNTVTGTTSILRVRFGPTTLTANIAAGISYANGVIARTNIPFVFEAMVTVKSLGPAGTVHGTAYPLIGAFGASVHTILSAPVTAAVAVNTAIPNMVELTYISGGATTVINPLTATIIQEV